MKILITGITGFVGSHLAEFYLNNSTSEYEIHGFSRWRSDARNIEQIKDKIIMHEGNIIDPFSVEKVIKEIKPNIIHHLAAQGHVLTSFNNPKEALDTNTFGTLNVLEAVKKYSPYSIVHIAGTSEEYGLVYENELPIKETNPLRPLSPYAVSKVAADFLGYQYHKSYGLKVIRTRAFNHIGVRQYASAAAEFAFQVAKIVKGKQEPIVYIFDNKPVRDYLDVKDICRAYVDIVRNVYVEYGDVYNICSGKGYSNEDLLNIMFKIVNISDIMIDIGDKSRYRPSDVPILIGDCSKFMKISNWIPTVPIERTLEDLINYFLGKIN